MVLDPDPIGYGTVSKLTSVEESKVLDRKQKTGHLLLTGRSKNKRGKMGNKRKDESGT